MKYLILILIVSANLTLHQFTETPRLVYQEDLIGNAADYTYLELKANNNLDRVEMLITSMEEKLKALADEQGANEIEVIIVEKTQCEIPTESQLGKRASLKILFRIK